MQDEEIILELDTQPDDLEDTHESLVIQGTIDSLSGVESYATKYLGGVLVSADMLSPNAVHGNESVWQTVKAGFSKSITYIKNFFKGIWNFFFGKDADAKDEATNAEVEKEKTELAKLPSSTELAPAAKTAIAEAASKATGVGERIKVKITDNIDWDKIFGEDKSLKEKLDEALAKMAAMADRGAEMAKKYGSNLAAIIQFKAALWALYFKEFRGVLTSQVKSLAAKTQTEIERLESAIKAAGESGVENLKQKLASLKEVMKSYTSIQQLKTSFKSFVTGILSKLKPSSFKKKEA